jgi:hypothetical protein
VPKSNSNVSLSSGISKKFFPILVIFCTPEVVIGIVGYSMLGVSFPPTYISKVLSVSLFKQINGFIVSFAKSVS